MQYLQSVVAEIDDHHEVLVDHAQVGRSVEVQILAQVLERLREHVVDADAVVARVGAEDHVAAHGDALRSQEFTPGAALAETDDLRRVQIREAVHVVAHRTVLHAVHVRIVDHLVVDQNAVLVEVGHDQTLVRQERDATRRVEQQRDVVDVLAVRGEQLNASVARVRNGNLVGVWTAINAPWVVLGGGRVGGEKFGC